MTNECDNLDGYLADELAAGTANQFARHLDECELCRNAVDEQRWIDNLLGSAEFASLESFRPELRHALHASLDRRRQTARFVACGLAAAAAVAAVAAGWTLQLNRQATNAPGQAPNHIAKTTDSQKVKAHQAITPRASFVSNGDTIAVPLESADANVTIVQLYPTTETERRTRRELALQFTSMESNGG